MIPEIFVSGTAEYQLFQLGLQMLCAVAAVAAAVGIVFYALKSIGLYSVAKRRRIKHPWLAWIPLGDYWILGSIADQYRYVCHNEVCSRRKILLIMFAVCQVLGFAGSYLVSKFMMITMENINQVMNGFVPSLIGSLGSTLALLLAASLVGLIVSVVAMVFYYISLHDFYMSCCPKHKNLFLVLSILFPVTIPFFIFGCRKGEQGMPPMKERQPVTLPPVEPEEEPVQENSDNT